MNALLKIAIFCACLCVVVYAGAVAYTRYSGEAEWRETSRVKTKIWMCEADLEALIGGTKNGAIRPGFDADHSRKSVAKCLDELRGSAFAAKAEMALKSNAIPIPRID
ncbi:MAG: hypothetical protein H5U22_06415 [Rhizobium sp.]|nr:hypothetical protein [Rhizobium sp.]